LEERLLLDGRFAYLLGIGNLEHGLNADIQHVPVSRDEHIRRLAEVSHLFLDAGSILIVTAVEMTRGDLDLIKVPVNPDSIVTVWVGAEITTDIDVSVHIAAPGDQDDAVERVKAELRRIGAIFTPY
ncbi:MAG: adenylyl-sulfate kinase, partial [Spirochaetota bacterium]